jgi:hypothetical protein
MIFGQAPRSSWRVANGAGMGRITYAGADKLRSSCTPHGSERDKAAGGERLPAAHLLNESWSKK